MKNLRGFSLRGITGFLAADEPTLHFLQSRQARVTVEEQGKQGFYVVPLKPQTDIHVRGYKLRILLKYSTDETLHLTVRELVAGKMLLDLSAPVEAGAGVFNLDHHEVHLRLDFDALSRTL